MANVMSIIWLIILIFISFFVAGFAAGFYILILPFTVCISGLSGLTDFLLSCVQFPRYCAQAMVDGKGFEIRCTEYANYSFFGLFSYGRMNVIYSFLWLIVFLFISFFVAFFTAYFYIIILPFTVCIPDLKGITDFLRKCVEFPKYCAQEMKDGKKFP